MFDAVISIGVVHHFCSQDRRVAAIQELVRIMRPGGKLMLYVWAYEQKHRKVGNLIIFLLSLLSLPQYIFLSNQGQLKVLSYGASL